MRKLPQSTQKLPNSQVHGYIILIICCFHSRRRGREGRERGATGVHTIIIIRCVHSGRQDSEKKKREREVQTGFICLHNVRTEEAGM